MTTFVERKMNVKKGPQCSVYLMKNSNCMKDYFCSIYIVLAYLMEMKTNWRGERYMVQETYSCEREKDTTSYIRKETK